MKEEKKAVAAPVTKKASAVAVAKPVVKEIAKPAVKEEAKAVVKEEVKTATATVKAPVKKEAKKVTSVKKEVKKAAPAKKPAAKKAEIKQSIHIEFSGKSYDRDDLMKIVKDIWKYDYKKKVSDLKSVELYMKPLEEKVYYVINDEILGEFAI